MVEHHRYVLHLFDICFIYIFCNIWSLDDSFSGAMPIYNSQDTELLLTVCATLGTITAHIISFSQVQLQGANEDRVYSCSCCIQSRASYISMN